MVPDISVIVPIYNVEEFIVECLLSLKAQTYENFEVLCINDCSTDNSVKAAKETVAGDKRFSFYEMKENSGLSAVRNCGLSLATGEFVLFLDSDDAFENMAFEKLLKMAQEYNLDDLFFNARVVYDNRELRSNCNEDDFYAKRDSIDGVIPGPEMFELLEEKRQFVCSACMQMIRRSLLEENGVVFYPGIVHEDELFTPLVLAYAKRTAFLKEPLYVRRMRSNSIMTSGRGIKNAVGLFIVTESLHKWLCKNGSNYSTSFCDALTNRLHALRMIMLSDALSCNLRQIEEYSSTLVGEERYNFLLQVEYPIKKSLEEDEIQARSVLQIAASKMRSVIRVWRGR